MPKTHSPGTATQSVPGLPFVKAFEIYLYPIVQTALPDQREQQVACSAIGAILQWTVVDYPCEFLYHIYAASPAQFSRMSERSSRNLEPPVFPPTHRPPGVFLFHKLLNRCLVL